MDDIYGYQNTSHRQATISLIAAGALLVIISVLVLWLVFWRHPSNKSVSTTKGASTSQQASTSKPKSSSSNKSNSKTPGSTNTKTSGETASNSTSSQTSSSGSQLPGDETDDSDLSNTGPGPVYILFATSVIAGTAFRHRQLSQRSK